MTAETAQELRGTAKTKRRGGKLYWYDCYRTGNKVRSRYLGPDTVEIAAQVRQHHAQRQALLALRKERQRLIHVLKLDRQTLCSAGTANFIAAFAAQGGFAEGAVLVGEQAFRFYALELGLADLSALTSSREPCRQVALAAPEPAPVALQEVVRTLPVVAHGRGGDWPWRWRRGTAEVDIAYLAACQDADEAFRLTPDRASRFGPSLLNYLIADPLPAALACRKGVLLRIPRPERFAIHKLLMAKLRAEAGSEEYVDRDRRQAAALLGVVTRARPNDVRTAWDEAVALWPTELKKRMVDAPAALELMTGASLSI